MELTIFKILIVLFSVVIHEVSHGLVAERLGDPTARLAGRLTLNPLKHLDPFGSVILPLILALLPGGVIFGWAKPVPYNPMNLKNPLQGGAFIAAAGPLSNVILAAFFAVLFRLTQGVVLSVPLATPFEELASIIVFVNLSLALFNLVPIPPLDGSKVLFALLPARAHELRLFLERYGFYFLLLFIFFGFQFFAPIIISAYRLLLGV